MNQSSFTSFPVARRDYPTKWGRPIETLLDEPELERLVLGLHSCSDLSELWSATRAILDALAPSDASLISVNFHDFARSWEASRIFVTPKADKSAGWMHRRRTVDIMPPYILAHPNLSTFRLSEVCPDPCELRHTEFFQRYMEPEGWHHCACLLFWQGARLHSQLTLWRAEVQGDFTAREMSLLGRLHPHLNTAMNRLSKETLNAIRPRALEFGGGALRGFEPVPHKCIATDDLGSSLPDVSRALPGTAHERHQQELIRARIEFSNKEREALRLAAAGGSNQEISRSLGVTIHTVKWYLANIYTKLGVRNRTAAVKAAMAMNLA